MVNRTLPYPKYSCIYGLRLVGSQEIRYIGLTNIGAENRLDSHRRGARSGDKRPLYVWMRDNGLENIEAVVVEMCKFELLSDRERHWIATLPNLLNMHRGGQGNRQWTDEARALMSERRKKQMEDPEFFARVTKFGKQSDETRRLKSEAQKLTWQRRYAGIGRPVKPSAEEEAKRIASYRRTCALRNWLKACALDDIPAEDY